MKQIRTNLTTALTAILLGLLTLLTPLWPAGLVIIPIALYAAITQYRKARQLKK